MITLKRENITLQKIYSFISLKTPNKINLKKKKKFLQPKDILKEHAPLISKKNYA